MRVLCRFRRHRDYMFFRIEELESLCEIAGISSECLWDLNCPKPTLSNSDVFLYINLPNDEAAKKIIERSVLQKMIIEVWAEGSSLEEVRDEMLGNKMDIFRMYINEKTTWAFHIDAYGKKLSQNEKVNVMNFFASLFSGNEKVDLKNPLQRVVIAQKFEVKNEKGEDFILREVYFGRVVALRDADPPWWNAYDLSYRVVLGPTTLDNELSFIMCNQARLKKGMIVLDPFVGTGGILLAASHFGYKKIK